MTRELTGRGVLFYLVAFFAVIFVVNAYFMVVAVTTFRGEDDLKPYQEGVDFNQTLARRAEQEKLGWRATMDVVRVDARKVHLAVSLNQADGSPETKVALLGEIHHPTDQNRDRSLRLTEVRPGDYEADVSGVSAGAWDVTVKTPQNSTPFEASRRVFVP